MSSPPSLSPEKFSHLRKVFRFCSFIALFSSDIKKENYSGEEEEKRWRGRYESEAVFSVLYEEQFRNFLKKKSEMFFLGISLFLIFFSGAFVLPGFNYPGPIRFLPESKCPRKFRVPSLKNFREKFTSPGKEAGLRRTIIIIQRTVCDASNFLSQTRDFPSR